MSKKIVIVDYSLGNIFSVQQAFNQFGAATILTNDHNELITADGIVLPGVGAFAEAMRYLKEHKLDIALKDVIAKRKPFLGICLGMQLLFDKSDEFGSTEGIGIISGQIKKFSNSDQDKKIHVPQVGWNNVKEPQEGKWKGTILEGVETNSYMYFVHSYYAVPKFQENVLCTTEYGGLKYCSGIIKDNITATQFHPEKSGEKGLLIYKNWLKTI